MESPKSRSKHYPTISILSFIGAIISLWQTKQYFETRSGMGSFHSFCNIGATFDCTAVEMSKYAEVFGGYPLASVALAGYLLILILSLFGLNEVLRRNLRKYLIAFTAIAVLFSLSYLAIMITSIGKWCLFCLVVDTINIAMLAVAINILHEEPTSTGFHIKHLVSAGVAAILIALLFAKGLDPQAEMKKEDLNDIVESVLNAAPTTIQIPADAPVIGDPNAPITIVKFSDYECPACKMGATAIHPLFKRYPKEVKFVFINYPLDQACNPNVPRKMHEFACEAALTAICATEQGKFSETYETLFDNQKEFAPNKINDLLLSHIPSLDAAKLKNCTTLPSSMEKIKRDVALGKLVNIQSTPTFFINGRKVEGGLPTNIWIQIIDRLLGTK